MASFSDIDYSFLGQPGLKGDYPVRVANLSPHPVQYILEDPRVNRIFTEATSSRVDTKNIQFHELYMLWQSPGGPRLVFDHLQIQDNKVREALNLPTDPEFSYSYTDIKNLVNNGTEEEIMDAIEFGPFFVPQWMKQIIVSEGLNDYNKRKFFSTLFNMPSLEQAQDLFEWSKGDSLVGSQYSRMAGEAENAGSSLVPGGRQRRAGNKTGEVELAKPVRRAK